MPQANPGFQPVEEWLPNLQEWLRKVAQKVNLVMSGKLNAYLDVTLTASATTTTVQDPRIGYYTAIVPAMALTANAKTAIVAGIWVDNIVKGSARLNHASAVATDQTIRFLFIG